jgi:hypothetical protein
MMGKRAHSVVVKMETLTISMNPAYAAVMAHRKDNAPDLSQRVQRLQKCHFVVLSYVIVHDDNSKI